MPKNYSLKKIDSPLTELIKISRIVGKDPALVQGGGGNTSVKSADGEYMFIKASGTALKDMSRTRGWCRLKTRAVLSLIQDKTLLKLEINRRETEMVTRLSLACEDKITTDSRPSVEAPLHALLDQCIIHLHPNVVGVYVNSGKGKELLQKLFKGKFPFLWVPYVDPGWTLARKVAALVGEYQKRCGRKPAILFLEKHGLLISAKSASAALKLVHQVITTCKRNLKQPQAVKVKPVADEVINNIKLCIQSAFFEATGRWEPITFFTDEIIAGFASRKDTGTLLARPALTPDELVYAQGPAMWVEEISLEKSRRIKTAPLKITQAKIITKLKSQLNRGLKPSLSFLVKDRGLFIVGPDDIARIIRDLVRSSLFIRRQAQRRGGILSLSKREQLFINNWEAEVFRHSLASKGPE